MRCCAVTSLSTRRDVTAASLPSAFPAPLSARSERLPPPTLPGSPPNPFLGHPLTWAGGSTPFPPFLPQVGGEGASGREMLPIAWRVGVEQRVLLGAGGSPACRRARGGGRGGFVRGGRCAAVFRCCWSPSPWGRAGYRCREDAAQSCLQVLSEQVPPLFPPPPLFPDDFLL